MGRKIGIISEHASPLSVLGGVDSGGQNVYVGQVARHLALAGCQVDVFTRRDSRRLPEIVEWEHGIRIIHVPAGPAKPMRKEELLPLMPEFTDYVAERCRRQPYDLLHANFFMSGLVAAEIKQRLGIPFVITFHALGRVRRLHQGAADEFPDERFAIEDRIVAEADALIAECPQDEEDLIRLYEANPDRITIIPCGFDPSELWPVSKAVARVALGLAPDERVILQLGRIVARKGVDNAIRGVGRLIRQHQVPARLLVVGGESDTPDPERTPELGRLQVIAAEEGVADHVTFVGRRGRDVLRYYYSAADIFVTTPWYEPFGITPVEAMACGTPVVGASVGGVKFSVRDAETGYLVPPNNPDALAERLAHLYRHPTLMEVFARQAVRRANDLFTWQRVGWAVADLYEQVLNAGRPRQPNAVTHEAVIERGFDEAVAALQASKRRLRAGILTAAEAIGACFARGSKVLICGNGGSAADAQHFASELVGRFREQHRAALPALALTADTALLTAWANDCGYEDVFARQVEAFGQIGDVLVVMSTSGRSRNLIHAVAAARRRGLHCIGLLGGDGGELADLVDLPLIVCADDTPRAQEVQLLLIHLVCELVEMEVVHGHQPWRVLRAAPETSREGAAAKITSPPRRARRAAGGNGERRATSTTTQYHIEVESGGVEPWQS